MNGAIIDTSFNVFFKLKYAKVYDAVLSTPVSPLDVTLGEIAWSLGRGILYSSAFLLFMLLRAIAAAFSGGVSVAGMDRLIVDAKYSLSDNLPLASVAKRRGALRHTDEGERFDDYAIRQEWWTGDALPDAKVVRRELAGAPRIEVAGASKGKVEELFWDTVTQVRAELAGIPRK